MRLRHDGRKVTHRRETRHLPPVLPNHRHRTEAAAMTRVVLDQTLGTERAVARSDAGPLEGFRAAHARSVIRMREKYDGRYVERRRLYCRVLQPVLVDEIRSPVTEGHNRPRYSERLDSPGLDTVRKGNQCPIRRSFLFVKQADSVSG